jgi:hypothetical protein
MARLLDQGLNYLGFVQDDQEADFRKSFLFNKATVRYCLPQPSF